VNTQVPVTTSAHTALVINTDHHTMVTIIRRFYSQWSHVKTIITGSHVVGV